MGSRGQRKKRSNKTLADVVVYQRRGLLESHAMSESHQQAYKKYLTFINRMDRKSQLNDENKPDGEIFIA